MNVTRLAIATVAAFVADSVYGYVVYGTLMASQFAQYPEIYRPASDTSHIPVLFAGIFLSALAAAYIYAKGYEGGSGVAEGARFGAAMGVFVGGGMTLINWAVLRVAKSLAIGMAAAGLVEWVVLGVVIGLVYKPAVTSKR